MTGDVNRKLALSAERIRTCDEPISHMAEAAEKIHEIRKTKKKHKQRASQVQCPGLQLTLHFCHLVESPKINAKSHFHFPPWKATSPLIMLASPHSKGPYIVQNYIYRLMAAPPFINRWDLHPLLLCRVADVESETESESESCCCSVVLSIKMPHLNAQPHKRFSSRNAASQRSRGIKIDCFHMDTNSVSPLPPMEEAMDRVSEKSPRELPMASRCPRRRMKSELSQK